MTDHLTGSDAERFARGELARTKLKGVFRHLLRGCEACAERLRPLLGPEPAALDEEAGGSPGREYDAPMARALAAVLSGKTGSRREEQARVRRALELLRSRPSGVFGLTDEEAEELRSVPLFEALLQLSFEERYRNPEEMVRLALLAKVTAENLDPRDYDPAVIADYQARAWAELGNAHRVHDELKQAEIAFNVAEQRLQKGSGNLLILARVADLRASLLSTQRLFSDACELLDGVRRLYLKVGDNHLAGRALVKEGIYTNYSGEPHKALRLLREGLALLDRERDPQLWTSATESILEVMVQCGEFREAARMLLESGLRESLAGQPLNLVKLRWVEGQIHLGLRKLGRAEAALGEARKGFLQQNQGYNAALAGLDLAAVWLEQGKIAEVEELAKDMLATFRRLGIQREGLRAMEYLNAACRRQRATPGLVRQIGEFLRQLEREPYLRFEAV